MEHVHGVRRRAGVGPGRDAAVDVQVAVALGLWRRRSALGRAVRVRVLQRDAHLDRAGHSYHGAVQAALVVRLLPDGHNDAADMPRKKSLKRDFVTYKRR